MSNRRQFLGTLGKALGFGGMLIPIAGKGALALPPDLGAAAGLPVRAAALPVSREGLQIRELRRVIHACNEEIPQTHARGLRFRALMTDGYRPLAEAIASRPQPTWADCVELAEICWQSMEKEWRNPTDDRDGATRARSHWARVRSVNIIRGGQSLRSLRPC